MGRYRDYHLRQLGGRRRPEARRREVGSRNRCGRGDTIPASRANLCSTNLGRPDTVHQPTKLQRGQCAEPTRGQIPHPRLRSLLAIHARLVQRLPRLQEHLGRALRYNEASGPVPRARPQHRRSQPDPTNAAKLERGATAGPQGAHPDHRRHKRTNLQPLPGRSRRARQPTTSPLHMARRNPKANARTCPHPSPSTPY